MRLQLKSTIQIGGGPEIPVHSAIVPASDPISSTLQIAERVVVAMLKLSRADRAVLRHYVGPALLTTIYLTDQSLHDARWAA
jgi:hypothetical protein